MTPRRVQADWRFWLVTAAAVAGVAATAALGRWQLDRAAQKQALQAAIDERQRQPALDGRALSGQEAPEAVLHRAVALRGHWLGQHTVFLDNRQMGGRQGFVVVTPLQLEHSPVAVAVQRGWVPRNFQDRAALPALDTPVGLVDVAGRVAPEPARLLDLEGGGVNPPGASRIRQNLDLDAFRAETGVPLAGLTVLQTGAAGDGLLRQWPVFSVGVEKHHGYAFQWFGLSGLIAILYVWFQLVRRFLRPRGHAAP
ncbi:SURF1 family protein [Simplicispira lacusdiani]|uniref:SURF1 family protein n=1 Tax=Simplicispira lacusdiani TaxID=2213010 RepID=UPI000E7647B4|nr:SURF1 family protein [Simplicispira lacusdiani]